MGAVVQTQNNNPAGVEESKKAAFGLPFPVFKWLVYRTNTHIIMYTSINYIEICCKYNHMDLQLYTGTINDGMARRIFTYRGRKYTLQYSADVNLFYIFNKDNTCIAIITPSLFEFYPPRAPEIGAELIWGLLAKLNIYPVRCF